MTIHEACLQAVQRLMPTFAQDQAWSDAERLLAHVLGKDVSFLLAHNDTPVTLIQRTRLTRLITRRIRHEPMEHLLGVAYFRHLALQVTKNTLIPRPETEGIIDLALKHLQALPHPTYCVDIGTGSGAIICSLASENAGALSTYAYIATDVSESALRVARGNARRLGLHSAVHFLRTPHFSDTLQQSIQATHPQSLLLLANLPYIPPEDLPTMHASVLAFEPHSALFAHDHGRADIRIVLQQIAGATWLHHTPWCALFECDPEYIHTLKPEAEKLFPNAHITIHADCFSRARFLEIQTKIPV